MIEIREIEEGDIEYCSQNPIEEAAKNYPTLKMMKPAYTGLVDGKIVGVGGVTTYWEGVGEAWLILTKDVLNFKVEAFMCVKHLMEKLINETKMWRLQATVRVDFIQAIKMLEGLGFHCEGIMEKYCPDRTDVYMMARLL